MFDAKQDTNPCEVVCIHGCLGSMHEFAPLRATLEQNGLPTRALPLLGHPGHPDGFRFFQVSAQAIVDDLLAQLRQLDPNQPRVIIGHSLGGLLTLGHAGQLLTEGHPLLGIATLGTPYDVAWTVNQPMGWLRQRSVLHLIKASRFVPDSMHTLSEPLGLFKSMRHYRRLRSETEWLFDWMQQRLALVTVPVHLSHGQFDLTVPCEAMDKLKTALTASPRVTTSSLCNFGHQVYPKSRAAREVTDDLLRFVHSVLSFHQQQAVPSY
jgi:pimeloyl-ACP methyl ester carboxylesterase